MADVLSNTHVLDAADGLDGSTLPLATTQVGGTDGTNLQTLLTDTTGKLRVNLNDGSGTAITSTILGTHQRLDVSADHIDGQKNSYSASKQGLVSANTATDIFTITGSGTKTVRILRIELSFTQSIYNTNDVLLIKRSSANSGGTSTSVTAVPHDSNNSAATATVLSYTSNPTSLGTSVGVVRAVKTFGQAANEPYGGPTRLTWLFGDRPSQAIVLRGTSQVLAINLNSTTISGSNFDISVEWSEE